MKKKLFLLLISSVILTQITCLSYAQDVMIQADKQNYNGDTNLMSFEGKVKVNFGNVTVKSPKAFIKSGQDGKPELATFTQGAVATKTTGISKSSIKANIIKVSLLENKLKAEGETNSTITENQTPVAVIRSNTQEFDIKNNIITASGNVNISYKDITANSNDAKITIDETGKPSRINLIGAAKVVQNKNIINAVNLLFNPVSNELIASGTVHTQTTLDDLTKVLIWSDYQQFDQNTNTLLTSGRVKISYKDYIATGPKATFLPKENSTNPNKIVFMGRSKIQENGRIIEADKLEITVDPKNFNAEGNVKSQFPQLQNKTADSSKKNKKR